MQRRGVTLIELMVLMFVAGGGLVGLGVGLKYGAAHGGGWLLPLSGVAGLAGGAVAGLLVPLTFGLLFSLVEAGWRAVHPPNRVCHCGWRPDEDPRGPRGGELLKHLPHASDLSTRGTSQSERDTLAGLARTPEALPDPLEARARKLDLDTGGPREWRVLRAGLPPRVLLAFGVGVAARSLDLFEREFHESRYARDLWLAARGVLDDASPASLTALKATPVVYPSDSTGCHVVDQPFFDHVLGRPTSGARAALVFSRLRHLAQMYAEPAQLWQTHEESSTADAYDSPAMRLKSTHPALIVEALAEEAAACSPDPAQERAWQHAFLSSLILSWESWDEDRATWEQTALSWSDRVQHELTRARFDVTEFAKALPRALVNWK